MISDNKIRLAILGFFIVFVLIWFRIFYWQVFQHERLSAAADAQHFYSLSLPSKRGEIKFNSGDSLVANKEAYLLYANLNLINKNDINGIAEKIGPILSKEVPLVATDGAQITPEEKTKFTEALSKELVSRISTRLLNTSAIWVNLAHFVSRNTKAEIEGLKIKGIDFATEQARDYPEGSASAHLIGFVGSDEIGNPEGYFGLEGQYNLELSGRAGQRRIEKDAFGRPIAIGDEVLVRQRDGNNLVTTIDRSIQFFVEKHLENGIKDWKAKGGTAIVMDPHTGAILAMSSFPRYDPANFPYYETKLYKNPAIADLYEPGSIMKPLVAAAAINEGKITADTRCDNCAGPRVIGGFAIKTFNDTYHPNLTMTETLINSDNTGMIFIGEKLGFHTLYSYMKRYGFGSKSGVDLEEEEEGKLRNEQDHYLVDQATLTFGQGISVNAVQMVKAFGALANGGKMVTPYVVDTIEENGGNRIKLKHPAPKKVLSETTSKIVTQMLTRVAKESPIKFPWSRVKELERFEVAAKSGTAQIAAGTGGYKTAGTTASVIGYFPANSPKYLIYVKLNEPEVRPWGSDTAGPVFFNIMRDLVLDKAITP